jgi:uncharacterized membrane protein YqjE
MTRPSPATGGLFASLRRLADSALDVVQVRLALFATEVEQEKLRIASALFLGAFGLMFFGAALVVLTGFVVLLFLDGYRLAALGTLGVVYAALGAWAVHRARAHLKSAPDGAFALSLGELRRDREGLVPPTT